MARKRNGVAKSTKGTPTSEKILPYKNQGKVGKLVPDFGFLWVLFKVDKPVADFRLKTVQVWGEADKPDADFSMFKVGSWFVDFSYFLETRVVVSKLAMGMPTSAQVSYSKSRQWQC